MTKKNDFDAVKGGLEAKVKMHDWLIIGVVIVVFLGFITMLVTVGGFINDSLAEKKAISQDIRDKVKDQNDKIEVLTESVNNLTKALQDEQKTIQKTN